jgi:hypothetical protein
MNLNLDGRLWLDLAQWGVTIALALALWLRKPGEDAGKAVEALRVDIDTRLQQHGQRITQIEVHMEHLPTKEELYEVKAQLREAVQRIAGMADGVGTIKSDLALVKDYLYKHGTGGRP